jgi:hypothetical protein
MVSDNVQIEDPFMGSIWFVPAYTGDPHAIRRVQSRKENNPMRKENLRRWIMICCCLRAEGQEDCEFFSPYRRYYPYKPE